MCRALASLFLAGTVQSEIERNTAGAVFIPEAAVIISSGLEATWVAVPIPGLANAKFHTIRVAVSQLAKTLSYGAYGDQKSGQ